MQDHIALLSTIERLTKMGKRCRTQAVVAAAINRTLQAPVCVV